MDFKTEVEVSLYDFEVSSESGEKRVIGLVRGKATLSWRLEIEARSWGVKDIYPYVPNQLVKAEVEIDDEGEDSRFVSVDLLLEDVETSVSIDTGTIAPSEISLYKKRWEVT
jgi:hypothetical protein